MRRSLFALAPLALVAACAGSGMTPAGGMAPVGGAGSTIAATTVTMSDSLQFTPAAVTVQAGQTVRFQNISSFAQTVSTTADTPAETKVVLLPVGAAPFDSGEIAPNSSYDQTFSIPGTYRYFSNGHAEEGMVGTINVTP